MFVKVKAARASTKLTSSQKSSGGKSKLFSPALKLAPGKRLASCTSSPSCLIIAIICSILAFQTMVRRHGVNRQEKKLTSAAQRMPNSTFGEGSGLKKELLAELHELRQWHDGWQMGGKDNDRSSATAQNLKSELDLKIAELEAVKGALEIFESGGARRDDMRKLAEEALDPEALKAELKQLTVQVEELEGQKKELTGQVEKYKGDHEELVSVKKELEATKEQLATEAANGTGLRESIKELQDAAAAKEELVLARKELEATKERLAAETASSKGMQGRIKELQDAAARNATKVQDLSGQIVALEEKNKRLESQAASDKSILSAPGGDCAASETKLTECRTAFTRLVTEKANLEMKLADGEGWQRADVAKEAMAIARETLAKCGKQTGGMVVQDNVPVWKGYACEAIDEELDQYFNYKPREMCPDDWLFVQNLIYVKNCFALPKRRCKNRTPQQYVDPKPFPASLFDEGALLNENVRWDLHQCKSFECLNSRMVGDCRNCFNMTLESHRWKSYYRGGLKMAEVIKMKAGTLRIGLDAGGGTGSFAAHMARFNVTVMTTAMNIETLWQKTGGLPYMETIALRGLIPLHVPHKARLPFFDNTLDVIHSVNSIKYLPLLDFEELIFEWDRVLRPGGIFWFEMFYAPDSEIALYIASVELLGYKKLYWNLTPKPDSGERANVPHTYLNALIEKPVRVDR